MKRIKLLSCNNPDMTTEFGNIGENMIDNIAFFIPWEAIKENYIEDIHDPAQRKNLFRNLTVKCGKKGVFCAGSISKYRNGNNIQNLNFTDIEKAFLELETNTGMDLNLAKLYSVEFGATLPVVNPASEYLNTWQKCPRTTKQVFDGVKSLTVTMDTINWSLKGYDKKAESERGLKRKGLQNLPTPSWHKQLLRIELKLKRKVKKQLCLSCQNVSPLILFKPDVYIKLINLWEQRYFEISKSKELTSQIETKINPSRFIRAITGLSIHEHGLAKIESFISNTQRAGNMDRITASKTRSMVRGIASDKVLFKETNLTEEVDELVRKVAARQRLQVKNFVLSSTSNTGDIK